MVLFHSISLYAEPTIASEEGISIEVAEDGDPQETQLKAYDALIPVVQGMASMVPYFVSNVVLLNEAEYQDVPLRVSYEHNDLETLFPLIISPNAP